MRRALAATLLLVSGSVHANGRLPAAGQIVVRGDEILVRTTFGVVLSRDHGRSWRYVCEKAMHYGGAQDPPYALAPSGSVLLVSSLGFVRGDPGGTHFDDTVPLRSGRDLDVSPDGTWVLTSNFAHEDDAGSYRFTSALLHADAEGRQLGAEVPLPEDVLFETVESLPGDPRRVVLSGAAHGGGRPDRAFLFTSDDSGHTLTRTSVPLEPGENSVYVAGIRGTRIFVRTGGGTSTPGRLLVTDFSEPAAARVVLRLPGPVLGFAVAPDAVYAGGRDGVWRAGPEELAFRRVSPTRVRCLAAAGAELWACPDDASLASVSVAGGPFTTKLTLDRVDTLASGEEVRAACTEELERLRAEFGPAEPPPARWPWFVASATCAALGAWLVRRRIRRFRAAR